MKTLWQELEIQHGKSSLHAVKKITSHWNCTEELNPYYFWGNFLLAILGYVIWLIFDIILQTSHAWACGDCGSESEGKIHIYAW